MLNLSRFRRWLGQAVIGCCLLSPGPISSLSAPAPASFRFAVLGDRTGEVQPGVYEEVWKEVAAERPAFVVSVGDTIPGLDDDKTGDEWLEVERILAPYKRFPLYLAAGNHDIWSPASEKLFERHAKHLSHYSFDYGTAHFTILDTSRGEELSAEELSFLESDLKAHESQPFKMIVTHQPTWVMNVAFANTTFPLHQLAKRYGVKYVVSGHVHQMLQSTLEGVTYISMPSSGGHLRLSEAYGDGWFFGYGLVKVQGGDSEFEIKELAPPHGRGRISKSSDWGMAGLLKK